MAKRPAPRRSDCPVAYALMILGDKWTLLVVRDIMLRGKRHYNEFLGAEEGISTSVLSNRLKQLEKHGVIQSRKDPESGRRLVYSLTRKGVDLVPVVIALLRWSAAHEEDLALDNKAKERMKRDFDGIIHEITTDLNSTGVWRQALASER